MNDVKKISFTKAYATAFHEAGHAVIAWHVGRAPREISLFPQDNYFGYCEHEAAFGPSDDPQYSPLPGDQERAMLNAMISMAGAISQRKYSAKSVRNNHASEDRKNAYDLACLFCISEEEIQLWLKLCKVRTEQAIEMLWPAIESVANAVLRKHGNLTGEEIEKAILAAFDAAPNMRLPKDRTCLGGIWTRSISAPGGSGQSGPEGAVTPTSPNHEVPT